MESGYLTRNSMGNTMKTEKYRIGETPFFIDLLPYPGGFKASLPSFETSFPERLVEYIKTLGVVCKRIRALKIKEGSSQYNALALEIMKDEIYPCQHCGHPVLEGLCCTGCNSDTPRD